MITGNCDPFQIFGLSRDASIDEIRRRYHELVLAYHPDRRGGNDPLQARKFATVRAAYEAILAARDAAIASQEYGRCQVCDLMGPLARCLDGRRICRSCLSRFGRLRLLPAPTLVILRCTFSVACLIAATACLALQFATGEAAYGLFAGGLGFSGLLVVALLGFLFPVTPAGQLRKLHRLQSTSSPR